MKKLTLIVFVLLAMASLMPLPDFPSRLGQQIQNSGHLMLGAALASLLITLNPLPSWFAGHRHLFFFGSASLILAVLEAAQYPLARDASVSDLVLGLLAAASIIIAHFALTQCHRGAKIFLTAFGGLLMIAGFLPLLGHALAYKVRDNRFPVLSDFSSRSGRLFVETRHANLMPDSSGAGHESLLATLCLEEERWAGLTLDEVFPDWTGFDYLLFDIEAENPTDRSLSIRVNDLRHDLTFTDRYNRNIELEPGVNQLAIPLTVVKALPSGRQMVMSEIDRIVFFSSQRDARACYHISDFRLLGGQPDSDVTILQ